MRLGVATMLCALLGLASCGDGPFEVQLSIELGTTIDSATQATIKTYLLHTSGDETFDDTLSLDPYAGRREGITYHPLVTSKMIDISITAENAAGVVVATGAVSVSLTPGKRTSAKITLETDGPDLGPDAMGVVPLAVIDFDGDAQDQSALLTMLNTGCQIETTTLAHSGTHDGYCNANGHYSLSGSFFGATEPTIAVRGYLRLDPMPSGLELNLLGFDDLSDKSGNYAEMGVSYVPEWSANYTSTTGPANLGAQSPAAFADANWHCVEMVLERPSTLTFYFDNDLIGSATNVTYPSVFQSGLDLGIFKGAKMVDGGIPDVGVHMDDIVVSTQRIGCD